MHERPLVLDADGRQLLAVLHNGANPRSSVGLVIIVGGPQYRVGSHRQFVILARALAQEGITVMRFDHGGVGDSDGSQASFDALNPDIRVGVDGLLREAPWVSKVALWGLCDGASAALIYAPADPRVTHLVLANPWVRTEESLAHSRIQSYYGARLLSGDFWQKVVSNPVDMLSSLLEFLGNALRTVRWRMIGPKANEAARHGFLSGMLRAAQRFRGRMLVILSADDLVATEFRLRVSRDHAWSVAFASASVCVTQVPDANHTFSKTSHMLTVTELTREFLLSKV